MHTHVNSCPCHFSDLGLSALLVQCNHGGQKDCGLRNLGLIGQMALECWSSRSAVRCVGSANSLLYWRAAVTEGKKVALWWGEQLFFLSQGLPISLGWLKPMTLSPKSSHCWDNKHTLTEHNNSSRNQKVEAREKAGNTLGFRVKHL